MPSILKFIQDAIANDTMPDFAAMPGSWHEHATWALAVHYTMHAGFDVHSALRAIGMPDDIQIALAANGTARGWEDMDGDGIADCTRLSSELRCICHALVQYFLHSKNQTTHVDSEHDGTRPDRPASCAL